MYIPTQRVSPQFPHTKLQQQPLSSKDVLGTYPSQPTTSISTLGNGSILAYVQINQPAARGLRPGVEDYNTLSRNATLLDIPLLTDVQLGEMDVLHADFVGLSVV